MTYSSTDFAHTSSARANRVAKAYRLADAIADLGRVPDEQERRSLLKAAGVRSASDETWSIAIDIYRERSTT